MAQDHNQPVFTAAEREYLAGQRLGRLVTIGADGGPQARPVGFSVGDAVIEIGGLSLTTTQKFRNVCRDSRVAFLVDDLASVDPWQVRGVEIRGHGAALEAGDGHDAVIRIRPQRIISWGIDGDGKLHARNMA